MALAFHDYGDDSDEWAPVLSKKNWIKEFRKTFVTMAFETMGTGS